MAVEIKNELRAAAIVDGRDAGGALQLFGLNFERTGVGIYRFVMTEQVDAGQHSIYCKPGINELAQPCGRFIDASTLEVRSYLANGTPADCTVLFVEVHRYPGDVGAVLPPAPPVPTPGSDGSGLSWHSSIITNESFQGVAGILYPWDDSASCEMTFPVGPADNALIGAKNVVATENNAFGFVSAVNDMEDPDTGANAVAGFYEAGSGEGAFGGSLALVIWRFSTLTDKWHIMHAAKRGSAEVLAPP